jgi:hypothetical protein
VPKFIGLLAVLSGGFQRHLLMSASGVNGKPLDPNRDRPHKTGERTGFAGVTVAHAIKSGDREAAGD